MANKKKEVTQKVVIIIDSVSPKKKDLPNKSLTLKEVARRGLV